MYLHIHHLIMGIDKEWECFVLSLSYELINLLMYNILIVEDVTDLIHFLATSKVILSKYSSDWSLKILNTNPT